jgi:hypothetical protein
MGTATMVWRLFRVRSRRDRRGTGGIRRTAGCFVGAVRGGSGRAGRLEQAAVWKNAEVICGHCKEKKNILQLIKT